MTNILTIAVDAMGGDRSPKKVIDGIIHHHEKNNNVFYKIFGDQEKISKFISNSLNKDAFEIIHTNEIVEGTDTPLAAAKRGKNTSMWMAIDCVKNKKADVIISAGNTGALFVIAKLNLKMIENIDKPALSGLWPTKRGMSVVLDLGANIECNDKNLIDFAIMGSSLFKSLFPNEKPKVALLNIGSEELKGNEIIKKTKNAFIALEIAILPDGSYVMQLKPEYSSTVKRYASKPVLPNATLKTLSYIAYMQPIASKQLVETRGSGVYLHLKELLQLDYISYQKVGRLKIYTTTEKFQKYFGIQGDVEDLKTRLFSKVRKTASRGETNTTAQITTETN